MNLAAMLKEMIDGGLTQQDIENLTEKKVKQPTVSKILSGEVKNVWSDKADAITKVYFRFKQKALN